MWRRVRITTWLAWAALIISCGFLGSLPREPRDHSAPDAWLAMLFLASAGWLVWAGVQRARRARWRRTRGRMTPTAVAAARSVSLPDRVDDQAARISALEARAGGHDARIDGLADGIIAALGATGTPVPGSLADEAPTAKLPHLRLVRDGEAAS